METAIHDALELQSEFHPEQPRVDKITAKQLQYSPHRRTPLLTLVIGAEETHTKHTIADSKTRHVIILGGWVTYIARVCRSKLQGKPKQTPNTPPQNAQVHTVDYCETDEYEDLLSLKIHNVNNPGRNVIWVDLKVDGKLLKMELDTGSAVSIITHELYMKKFNEIPLQKTELLLKTYTGENITPVGVLKANVEYKGQQPLLLDLYVVKGKGPVLMGRDWLYKLRLDWCAIKSLNVSQATLPAKECLDTILDKYSDVFEDKLGTFKSVKAKLTLKEDAQVHFHKARVVPYALRPKVEEELRRLQNEGILMKVEWREWELQLYLSPRKMDQYEYAAITKLQ